MNSIFLNTLFASYNTIMLNTGPYHETFETIDSIISLTMSTIVVVLFVLYSFSLVCWVTYLVLDCRKSNRSASRIESLEEILSPESAVIVKNYRFNAKKDKILIILILTEGLAFFSNILAYSYHLIDYFNHDLHWTGLPFNSTCIQGALEYKIWVDELRYPIVGFLLSCSRATSLIVMGLFDYLLKFISNTYVTRSWQYKRIHNSVIYALILSFSLVLFGTIPYTNVFSHFLIIAASIVYLRFISKHLSFLSDKALVWREQDMQYNVRSSFIRRERLRKRRFIFFSNMVYYGAVVVLTMETFETLESVVELFLYYGKCIFPVLYGIPYTPPISDEQLPQFHMALVIISCIEYICTTFGVILIFLPPLVFSFAFFINALNNARKQRLLTYRFSGNVHSELNRPLI